jgi:hypothetical protein
MYGSAFALIRIMFEAYVRGVWLHRCASYADIKSFCNDKFNKTFDSWSRSPYWTLSLNGGPGQYVSRSREGLQRLGARALLRHDPIQAQEATRRSLGQPSSTSSHAATMLVPPAGSAPHALHAASRMALGKPRGAPCVKPPRRLRCPVARSRPGGRSRTGWTNSPLSWPFAPGPEGGPAGIVWGAGSPWGGRQWGPGASAWGVAG